MKGIMMDRIDKSRKGVVWEYWTEEERAACQRAVARGGCLLYLGLSTGKWYEISILLPPETFTGRCYWIREWDEPTGEELVGYLCAFANTKNWLAETQLYRTLQYYLPDEEYPYIPKSGGHYKFCRRVRPNEIKIWGIDK